MRFDEIKRIEVIREAVDDMLTKWWDDTEHRLDYEMTEYDNGAPLTAETKEEFFVAAIEALRQLADDIEKEGRDHGWIAPNQVFTQASRLLTTASGTQSTTAASAP